MLMKSDINPFDSPETKPYKNDPRIAAMTDLVDAYQRDDIHSYENVLAKNRDLLADPFIAENIDEINRTMRMKAVVKLIAPYTRFTLDFVAQQLKINPAEVQDVVSFLVLDGTLQAEINQEEGIVEMQARSDALRSEGLAQWTGAVRSLFAGVLNEGEGFRPEEAMHGLSTTYPQAGLEAPPLRSGNGRSLANGWGKSRSGTKKGNARLI